MESITAQDQAKVAAVSSKPSGSPKTKKYNNRSKSSSKTSSKAAAPPPPPSQPQLKPSSKRASVKTTDLQRKNTQKRSSSKKTNSSPRKSSSSSHSTASSSSEDNLPPLMYASASGTESDDSEHLDTQLSYDMYRLDVNSSRKPHTKHSKGYHQNVTIVKQQDVKYAGPTFSNAPTPDMLPLPGFNTPKVVEAPSHVELQRRSRDLFNLLVPPSQQKIQQMPPLIHNVYNSPPPPERALTLNEIQQGLRVFLNIQA
jgi:hypothetical protein